MSQNFSALFIFGDSLVDVGNNNYITTLAKANYGPIGVDFGKPTGRFTNGRTVEDIIGESLGFQNPPPPYMAPTTVGPMILRGVNYASGSSGILKESGANYIGRIAMDTQVENFAKTRLQIISSIGVHAAIKLFTNALFTVTTGSNDFINNYYQPHLSKQASPKVFTGRMVSTLKRQLTKLYHMGARNIVVANVPPIGCCPYFRDHNPRVGNKCVGSTFVYADVYHIAEDVIHNYRSYGFEIVDRACCHTLGRHGGLVPCMPHTHICPDRSKYMFWDWFHVTEAANAIIAKRVMDGDLNDIWPINLRAFSNM
ncbi:GDSL esterase/lipase-like protein [Tanacetum coccineum]